MIAALLLTLPLIQSGPTSLETLKSESTALRPVAKTELGRAFLDAVRRLPSSEPRTVFRDEASKRYFAEPGQGRKDVRLDERFYYYTRYGSPLAYLRPVEILGKNGVRSFRGLKLLDFGYGGIGPLRLVAESGGFAIGVDVDSLLKSLYSQPEDLAGGRIRLVEGYFPTDPKTIAEIGTGYDVFLSKNTLKRGYVHPERPASKAQLIDLGVSDVAFCRAVAATLKSGGLFLIYNLSSAQSSPDMPFNPSADGRCPFSKADLEASGFQVLALDASDDAPARDVGGKLGWDKAGMDLDRDLFGLYTLARKR